MIKPTDTLRFLYHGGPPGWHDADGESGYPQHFKNYNLIYALVEAAESNESRWGSGTRKLIKALGDLRKNL